MPSKNHFISSGDNKVTGKWAKMSNAQRAKYLLNQYEVLTKGKGKIAKQLNFTKQELAKLWADYQGLKQWADYEQQLNSILDRDLVADVNELKLFDNTKDPRDPSNHPEPPENLRHQAALLWPFN